LTVPAVSATWTGVVIPKNDGRDWIFVLGAAPLVRLPVTRVKRRYKVSALAAAVAGVPEAAVKAVT
jgi:hypothetical protein